MNTVGRAGRNILTLVASVVSVVAMPLMIYAQAGALLEVGKFSTVKAGGEFPEGWKPLTFKKIKRHTTYAVVEDADSLVVKAVSDASSSGLIREIQINPREYPVVKWRWKVANVLEKGDVSRKAGDDYPARIYVTFAYDSSRVGFFEMAKFETFRLFYGQYPPIGAINYIWESKAPKGTVVPNPFTDRVQMVVVETGTKNLNVWVSEERNIYEDYKAIFKEEPPMISGVAIMTDTDNTGEAATAYFGDIVFKKANVEG
ncbi:MAG: DUF3047 domain-containing protein [Nitrospiraceae bacterium]